MTTQKYLLIYRSPFTAGPGEPPSPDQMQAILAAWTGWKEKFKEQVVDLGDGLKPGGKQLAGGVVIDGAFIESKEVVGGFSIIAATSYEQAIEVARACPIVQMPGYNIEIRELAGF